MKTSNSILSGVIVSVLGLSATLSAPRALSEPGRPVKPGAVEISIFGIGPPVDGRAVNKVRRTVGASIATGVTDTYFVRGYGIEGGFSACAQKNPFASRKKFAAFVNRLKGITPDPTTTSYSVDLAVSCDEPVFCTADAKICPDGSAVSRVPPTCEFAACPGK